MKKRYIALTVGLTGALVLAAVPASLGGKRAGAQETLLIDRSIRGIDGAVFSAADLLELVYGESVGKTEADWLAESKFFELRYSDAVPASLVELSEHAGKIVVTAQPYTYTAQGSGDSVTFLPVSVGDAPFELTDGVYTLTLNEDTMSEDNVTVLYKTTFTVPAETVTSIANAAYSTGEEIHRSIAEDGVDGTRYRAALEEYRTKQTAYETYLEAAAAYELAAKAYRQYLSDYAAWSRRDRAYRTYEKDYAAYLAAKEEYDSYGSRLSAYYESLQAYQDYLSAEKEYEEAYAAYLAALEDPDRKKMTKQLEYLDFIEEAAYLNEGGEPRTLYSAVMGNSVTSVLAQRETLIAYSRSFRAPIELAEKVTHILREDILPRYHALREASVEEKYSFYITYHDEIRDNFCELLRALDWLYRQKAVRIGIKGSLIDGKDRTPQYRMLLAQLFYICNFFSDGGPVSNYDIAHAGGNRYYFDENYRIDGYKPSELLLGSVIPADGEDSAPLTGGLPPAIKEPVAPEEVAAPSERPQRPREPVAPEKVDPPGDPPAPMSEPEAPEKVEKPVEPQPFVPTEAQRALAADFEEGKFVPRAAQSEDLLYDAYARCVKYLPSVSKALLRFHLTENAEEGACYEIEYRPSGTLDTAKLFPYKERKGYTCTFAGWVTEEGGVRVPFDPASVRDGEMLELYPAFEETPVSYPVIWEIDGIEETDTCAYGSSPVYHGVPMREGAGAEYYRFTGWDDGQNFYPAGETLPTMSENGARYTAQFESAPIATWSGGEAPVRYEEGVFYADLRSVYTMEADLRALIVRAADLGADLELSRGSERFYFSADAVETLEASGVARVMLNVTVSGANARRLYSYGLSFSGEGGSVLPDCSFTVYAKASLDPAHAYLIAEDGGQRAFRTEGEMLVFTERAGERLSLVTMYSVGVIASDAVSVATSARGGLARPGDLVEVQLGEFAAGRYLSSIYVLDGSGTPIALTENAFTMPEGDVTVGIIAAYHVYTVVFRSEDKILHTASYRYGDTIEAPAPPSKPTDGEFSYVFTGWDHDVGTCMGDDVFTALYRAEPLPVQAHSGPGKLYYIIMAAKIGLPILGVGICGLAAFFIVRKVLKRRRRAGDPSPEEGEACADGQAENPPEEGASDGENGNN